MDTQFDVAIVGGGAAGIGAARRLAMAGRSVVVLEATARLGGRAWTVEQADLHLDLGCGWLHSAERNSWAKIAETSGFALDRRRAVWGEQHRDLGFPPTEQAAAKRAYAAWFERMTDDPPPSDRGSDALHPGCEWNPYLEARSGFISGDALDQISIEDYLAYDEASTNKNWRVVAGYGAMIAASFPPGAELRLSTPVTSVDLNGAEIELATPLGAVRARVAILTVSTSVLAGDTLRLPAALDNWRQAATRLPLGRNEKLFLEIVGKSPFVPETQVIGDPHDVRTGAYYIRPLNMPVIEGFFGGEGARWMEDAGSDAGFAYAIDQLAALFGSGVRRALRPLVASAWSVDPRIGGAYSYALPGHAAARAALARPHDQRLFFAGEAANRTDFSTAHGAHDSGVRAAEEAIAALNASAGDASCTVLAGGGD